MWLRFLRQCFIRNIVQCTCQEERLLSISSGPSVLAFSSGLWGRKGFYLLKQRVASTHPCFLFILFQKLLFFRNQELAFSRSLCFRTPFSQSGHLFFEYFHFSYPAKIPLIKRSPCGLFNNPCEGEGTLWSVQGIPTDGDGT